MLVTWLVGMVKEPDSDVFKGDAGAGLQASAAIAGYSFVVLAMYVVHLGVHLALSYDSSAQLRSFATVMDTGSMMYMRISLLCAVVSACIELAAPWYLARTPELQVTLHATHAASLTDMVLRTVWLPISTPQDGGLQPLATRIIPWVWLLGGGVAPVLAYFLDLRVLPFTITIVLLAAPLIALAITLPLILGDACCASCRPMHPEQVFDEARAPAASSCGCWCTLPNLYAVQRAPPEQRESMKHTIQRFKPVLLPPVMVAFFSGILFFMTVMRDVSCTIGKLSQGRARAYTRLHDDVRSASIACEPEPWSGYWTGKRVASFWFLFASISAACIVYSVRLMVALHSLVQELKNSQQQSAGMLRFLSHECRSPLFVVLLMLNNLVEDDMPSMAAEANEVAPGGDASALTARIQEVSTTLVKMQKPLQLLRSVLDNMLSYLKLKQQRWHVAQAAAQRKPLTRCQRARLRAKGQDPTVDIHLPCGGDHDPCEPCAICARPAPAPLDAGAVMTEIGAMFPVLVEAMECKQPGVRSDFKVQGCACASCRRTAPPPPAMTAVQGLQCLQCLPIWASVQATTLKQALTNMLTNAVKYGRRGDNAADISVHVTLSSNFCPSAQDGGGHASPPSGQGLHSTSLDSAGGGSIVLASAGGSLVLGSGAHRSRSPSPDGDIELKAMPPRSGGSGAASLEVGAPGPLQGVPAVLQVSVTDQGRGLSAQDQQLLFKPFERLRAGEQQQGTGLGLWLMHELLDFQGGGISVASEGVGKGCTFVVSVPCRVEQRVLAWLSGSGDPGHALQCQPDAVPRCVPSSGLSAASVGSSTPGSTAAPASSGGSAEAGSKLYPSLALVGAEPKDAKRVATLPPPSRSSPPADANRARPGLMRVLLVDDSRAVLAQLCNALKRKGFEVKKAANGAIALKKVQEATTPFDLIVCDMSMPVMTGPEFAAALTSAADADAASAEEGGVGAAASPLPGLRKSTPTIFIGLTGNAMGSDVESFKRAGAHAVLIKPAAPNSIINTATALQTAFMAGQSKASPPPLPDGTA